MLAERVRPEQVAALLQRNNAVIRRLDGGHDNPRRVEGEPWHRDLVAAHPAIRAEWDAFEAAGGELPLIEETLGRPDQNEGAPWHLAPLVFNGGPADTIGAHFPRTVAALLRVPHLRSASWSVLGAGGWIPEHRGPNGGCLRMLVGVDAEGASLTVDGNEARFRDGHATVFDDTFPHSVRNDGDRRRVILLCDLTRPLRGPWRWPNRGVQRALHVLTPAYREGLERGAEHFRRRNPTLLPPGR